MKLGAVGVILGIVMLIGSFGSVSAVANCKYDGTLYDGGIESVTYGASHTLRTDYDMIVCRDFMTWGSTVTYFGNEANIYVQGSNEGDCSLPGIVSDPKYPTEEVIGFEYWKDSTIVDTSSGYRGDTVVYDLCRLPIHGDGLVKCDEGFDGCEECDDGNLIDGDGCNLNGLIEDGYECIGEPSVCTEIE